MKTRIAAFVLAGAGIALACIEDHSSAPQVSRSPDVRANSIQGQRRRSRTIDDVYADIAKGDSTFGGFFFDSMHVPVVYLTNTARLASVRAAGLDGFLRGRRHPAGALRVRHAAYGYGTLMRWYACAWPRVLGLPDGVLTDIDEARNRLRFGVAVATAIGDVRRIVAQCGIPPQAVAVDVVELPRLKDGLNDSLNGDVRPVRAGTQIMWDGSANGACTIGIVGRSSEGIFFTTAAHCSEHPFLTDPTRYRQGTYDLADTIGREFRDAPLIHHSDWDDCPEGYACVFADVNMSHFQPTATVGTAQVGLIARGMNPSWDVNTPGSLALDQAHPVFVTGVDTTGGQVGDAICKTGRTTGTTCGHIIYACFNAHWNHPPINEGYSVYNLCSSEADMHSDGGDSGAPIWVYNSTDESKVVLAGVLWGGPPESYTTKTYYSPLGRVVDELYWDGTVTVIADSPYVVGPPPGCGHWEVRPVLDGNGEETGSYYNVWVPEECNPPPCTDGHWESQPILDGNGEETGSYHMVWVPDPGCE